MFFEVDSPISIPIYVVVTVNDSIYCSYHAVKVLNRPHVIAALVDIPESGAEGVLLSHGGNSGGYTLFVKDGKLHYVHNYVGSQEFHLTSEETVPPGRAILSYEFEVTNPPDIRKGKGASGVGKLFINEKPVGQMELPVTMPITISIDEGLTCGQDPGSTVTEVYGPPFAFTGTLQSFFDKSWRAGEIDLVK